MKQVILVRTDLKLGKGKIATECAHASVAAFLKVDEKDKEKWLESGMKKIVLKVANEKELLDFYKKFRKAALPCEIISDKGLTQVKPGTKLALGCGPAQDKNIDRFTSKLKLL